MNLLDGAICYLIGAIDNADDKGSGWRKDLINECEDRNLDIKFLDPTNKVTGLQKEIDEEHENIMSLKADGEFDKLSVIMKQIVREDHRSVDLSDFVVFYIDPSIHTCGSYFEFQSALTEKKPYYVIINGGKNVAPSWLFGICDHEMFVGSVEEVAEDLVLLNEGKKKMSNRWVLFREQIKNL